MDSKDTPCTPTTPQTQYLPTKKRTIKNNPEQVRPILLEVFEEDVLSSCCCPPAEPKIISFGFGINISSAPEQTGSPAHGDRHAVSRREVVAISKVGRRWRRTAGAAVPSGGAHGLLMLCATLHGPTVCWPSKVPDVIMTLKNFHTKSDLVQV